MGIRNSDLQTLSIKSHIMHEQKKLRLYFSSSCAQNRELCKKEGEKRRVGKRWEREKTLRYYYYNKKRRFMITIMIMINVHSIGITRSVSTVLFSLKKPILFIHHEHHTQTVVIIWKKKKNGYVHWHSKPPQYTVCKTKKISFLFFFLFFLSFFFSLT